MNLSDKELQIRLIQATKTPSLGSHMIVHQTATTTLFVWCADALGAITYRAPSARSLQAVLFSIDIQDSPASARLNVKERNKRLLFDDADTAEIGLEVRGRNRTSNREVRFIRDIGSAASYGATIVASGRCSADAGRSMPINEQLNLVP
jgi:hypothetical protein